MTIFGEERPKIVFFYTNLSFRGIENLKKLKKYDIIISYVLSSFSLTENGRKENYAKHSI